MRWTWSNTVRPQVEDEVLAEPGRHQPLDEADAGVEDGDAGDEEQRGRRPCSSHRPRRWRRRPARRGPAVATAEHGRDGGEESGRRMIVRRCGRAKAATRRTVAQETGACRRSRRHCIALWRAIHMETSVTGGALRPQVNLRSSGFAGRGRPTLPDASSLEWCARPPRFASWPRWPSRGHACCSHPARSRPTTAPAGSSEGARPTSATLGDRGFIAVTWSPPTTGGEPWSLHQPLPTASAERLDARPSGPASSPAGQSPQRLGARSSS